MAELWIAYIGVAGSLAVAVFSLLTSGRARELALRAEATAKRHEQIRLKGLEAAEKFLSSVADLHLAMASMRLECKTTCGIVRTDSVAMKDLIRSIEEIGHLRIQCAMYWTEDIRNKISKLYDDVLLRGAPGGDFSIIEQQVEELTEAIVELCKQSYL
ncbi:MAG: hypothetical protein ACYTFW_12630 [Planctomycetota bacterium]|jgi:hypothetical protein